MYAEPTDRPFLQRLIQVGGAAISGSNGWPSSLKSIVILCRPSKNDFDCRDRISPPDP